MRISVDAMWLEVATILSKRGTCAKKQVGCVIVDAKGNVLATGYNGQPRGHKHCTIEEPCEAFTDPSLSCKAIHAEMNALIRCADIDKINTVYITERPCDKCLLLIKNTAARTVVYKTDIGRNMLFLNEFVK